MPLFDAPIWGGGEGSILRIFQNWNILELERCKLFVEEKHFQDGKIGVKSCSCVGCLKKRATNTRYLHLYTKSLLNSVKEDSVKSSALRLCPNRKYLEEVRISHSKCLQFSISPCSMFSKHDSKKEPGLILDVYQMFILV